MNIFKSFETFLKEPLSILKNNFIQIVSIQTGNIFAEKPSVDISIGYLFLKGKSWEKTIGIFIDHPSPKLGIFIFSMIL